MLGGTITVLAFLVAFFLNSIYFNVPVKQTKEIDSNVDLLTINEFSRPGSERKKINGIVIHYVGNPNTTAKQNRDYFESLKDTKERKASSHYIIGLEGEIIQCIPLKEIAYASNSRNKDTISIEVCHPDETGKFNDKTYQSLVKLTSWLSGRYRIKNSEIIRHYDITGKNCPKYFVEHEKAWDQFKKDVDTYIEEHGTN